MKHKIIRTEKADEQLWDIIYYIADDSGSVDIALNYLDKIESAINLLADFPYLVFNKVNDDERVVTLYAIEDGRREYRNLI